MFQKDFIIRFIVILILFCGLVLISEGSSSKSEKESENEESQIVELEEKDNEKSPSRQDNRPIRIDNKQKSNKRLRPDQIPLWKLDEFNNVVEVYKDNYKIEKEFKKFFKVVASLSDKKTNSIYIEGDKNFDSKSLAKKLNSMGLVLIQGWVNIYRVDDIKDQKTDLLSFLEVEKGIVCFVPVLGTMQNRICVDGKVLLEFTSIEDKELFWKNLPKNLQDYFEPDLIKTEWKHFRFSIAKPKFKNRMNIQKILSDWREVVKNRKGMSGLVQVALIKFTEEDMRKIDEDYAKQKK